MQTFLELLATDPKIDFSVTLEPVSQNGDPLFWIMINDHVLAEGVLEHSIKTHCELNLLDPIRLQIGLKQKQYSAELETAVILRSVNIDGFEIVPNWTHLAVYENDHNNASPTSYLGYNGTWCLTIVEPFYRWRHRITGQGWLLEPTSTQIN